MKKTFQLAFLTFVILIVPLVHGADVNEYLNEFGNDGESCIVTDYFAYNYLNPTFLSSQHHSLSVPTFYRCCKVNECTTIIFDSQGQKFLPDSFTSEIIDINYIRYELQAGNISETQFITHGLDACSFFGSKEFNQESLNLAAQGTEGVAEAIKTKKAKQVVTVIRVAKDLRLIDVFDPATFAVSVACRYNNKKIKSAVETLATCNNYLNNIARGYSETYYVNDLSTCIAKAQTQLKEYLDSTVAQVKNVADKFENTIVGFYNLATNKEKGLKIEDTEYEVAKNVLNEISGKQIYLHNPHNMQVLLKQSNRINEKTSAFNSKYTLLVNQFHVAKTNKPRWWNVTYVDLFMEPNFNISEANSNLKLSEDTLNQCLGLFKISKFSSAIACLTPVSDLLENATTLYSQDAQIERKYDWKGIIFTSIIIVLIILVFWKVKNMILDDY